MGTRILRVFNLAIIADRRESQEDERTIPYTYTYIGGGGGGRYARYGRYADFNVNICT